MQISKDGIAFVERHEGVVLKAYRDPVGIWTIGAGLTKASGVIDPKPGMMITRETASLLMKKAISRSYGPRVEAAMTRPEQNEFDAGVSFDYNTGAIHKATWVPASQKVNPDWSDVAKRLLAWNKGGGRVLPGLTRRRREEFVLLKEGRYTGGAVPEKADHPNHVRWALPMDDKERVRVLEALRKLGYVVTSGTATVVDEIKRFQREHDLKPDGIIGRATLSTLERRLAAATKAKAAGATTIAGGAVSTGSDTVQDAGAWALVLPALGIAYALIIAWKYRDAIAAKVAERLPRVAAFLRSW